MKKLFFVPFRDLRTKKKNDTYTLNLFNDNKTYTNQNIIDIKTNHQKSNQRARKLEKKIFQFLVIKLNKIHQINFNERQWNIILGYWVRRFSNVISYRFFLIDQLTRKYNFKHFLFCSNHNKEICNKNSYSFIKSTNDAYWNDILFFKILNFKNIFYNKKYKFEFISNKKFLIENYFPYKRKNFLINFLDNLLSIFTGKLDNVIKINKLTYLNNVILSFKLKQIFRFYYFPDENTVENPDYSIRKKINENIKINKFDEFNVAKKLLFEYLPETYLENFKDNLIQIKKINAPSNPKKIVTDNDFDTNELFKLWTAIKIKNNSKYFILQHGNNYGTAIHTINNPELIMSDRFFSWGCKEDKKIYKGFNYQVNKTEKKNLLPCTYLYLDAKNDLDLPYNTNNVWKKYIEQNYIFLKHLNKKKNFKIIPHPYYISKGNFSDYDKLLEFRKYFQLGNYPNLPELAIYGYDSTGFLNRLTANIPTISFFKIKNFNLRKNVIKDYLFLKNSNIIFENPKKLSFFINNNIFNARLWWYDNLQQNKINFFTNKYSRFSNNIIEEIKKFIN